MYTYEDPSLLGERPFSKPLYGDGWSPIKQKLM